jgi:Insertion element 4 transposase N-terminal/Transposase DDE domain
MIDLFSDLKQLANHPSDERVRALERIIPRQLVQEVLTQTGHARRRYKILPAWFVVWFVIGLGLFAGDSHTQVYKHLQRFRRGGTPRRSALGEARNGLGVVPLRLLAARVIRLLATPQTPGAFYKRMRLVGLDSFVVDLPDTPVNDRVFGRPQSGRAAGAFPQARILSLCELGTHVLYKKLVKPIRCGEVTMADYLLRWLEEDMLLLWDRNFLSYKNLKQVKKRQSNLLARIKKNLLFEPIEVLSDGSYLAKAYPSSADRAEDRHGILVRIIKYTLTDPNRPHEGEVHRLLTTLLDADAHPAEELVMLYHERWDHEGTIAEVKTYQLEQPVLRSKTPAGVIQEIEGLLLAHYLVRTLMFEAAQRLGLNPRRLSFTATLKILRCRLPEVPRNDEAGLLRWWEELLAEVGEAVLEPRRDRCNPRVIKRKMSKWPKKRPHHRKPPQPTKPFRDSIQVEQPKHSTRDAKPDYQAQYV